MSEILGGGGHASDMGLIEPQSKVPENMGHPVRILMEEHVILLRHTEEARDIATSLKSAKELDKQVGEKVDRLRVIADYLLNAENHYLREENTLFPYLEKHGITGPPAAMWVEHQTIRATKKNFHALVHESDTFDINAFANEVAEVSDYLKTVLATHFYKENNVLFQMALDVITDNEWVAIRDESDEIGYCCFTPAPFGEAAKKGIKEVPEKVHVQGVIDFESGQLLANQIEALLNTLPIEITFIDADDTVRYFSRSEERVFVRTKASLGRLVQQCHPAKSIHLVNEIVADFKSGKRDVADFWLEFKDRFLYIRFFPVRDRQGSYLGCVEVVQNVTDIKKLEGEKRLL